MPDIKVKLNDGREVIYHKACEHDGQLELVDSGTDCDYDGWPVEYHTYICLECGNLVTKYD